MKDKFRLLDRVTMGIVIIVALVLGWLLQTEWRIQLVLLPALAAFVAGFGRRKHSNNSGLQNFSFFLFLISLIITTYTPTISPFLLILLTLAIFLAWIWRLLWIRLHAYDSDDGDNQTRITTLLNRYLIATLGLSFGTLIFFLASQRTTLSLQLWPAIFVAAILIGALLASFYLLRSNAVKKWRGNQEF